MRGYGDDLMKLKIDSYGTVVNCADSALFVARQLGKAKSVAIALDLGNMTMLHVSFVPLWHVVPDMVIYNDGSKHGVQINIDRFGSYGLPVGSQVAEWSYLDEKFQLGKSDAEAFLPFLNTVLSGQDRFI